ncbi:MAG: hypothetical protein ABIK07_13770 [Planctomycetota bacterium]
MKKIYTAIESHDLAKVTELLKHGVSPNITAEDGTTPLLLAFRYDEPIFRLLLDAGANPGIPVHVKFPTAGILLPGESVLTLAAAANAPWFEILTEFPMDVNHRGYRGDTVTHRIVHALALPPVKMPRMEWIVKHGADLSLKNEDNETPLIMSLHGGPIMVNFLVDAGGTPDDRNEFERIIRLFQERVTRAKQKSDQPLASMYASILEHLYQAYRAKFGTAFSLQSGIETPLRAE